MIPPFQKQKLSFQKCVTPLTHIITFFQDLHVTFIYNYMPFKIQFRIYWLKDLSLHISNLDYFILQNANLGISKSPILGCKDIGIRKSESFDKSL